MTLTIPDGASVHITINTAPMLAMQHDGSGDPVEREAEQVGTRRPLLMGVAGILLLVAAFAAGHRVGHPSAPLAANAAAPQPTSGAPALLPAPVLRSGGVADQAPPSDTVPPSFTRELANPPQVTAPPGQPPAGSGQPAANPFGLQG